MNHFGALNPPAVGCDRRIDRSLGVSGGNTITSTLKAEHEGWMVGSQGAGPCVIVAAYGPQAADGSWPIVVSHDTAKDKVTNLDLIPEGAKVAIAGGTEDTSSRLLLQRIGNKLHRWKKSGRVTVEGFYDSHQLWVGMDRNGNIAFRTYGR